MSAGSAVIAIPEVPQSFNRTAYAHWRTAHRAKARLQTTLEGWLLACSELPRPVPGGQVTAWAELRFQTRRRRDQGNYRTPLEKALGDALVNGGWIPDDTPDHFRFERLEIATDPGEPTTWITLAWGPSRPVPLVPSSTVRLGQGRDAS